LEPDLRCSESQPLFAEVGLQALHTAGIKDAEMALELCRFLESVADESGLVPPILEGALHAAHASHWTERALAADLNPTIGICGMLHYQGVEHGWLNRASETCVQQLLIEPPKEAHTLLGAAHFVEHLPDRKMAERLFERVAESLPKASFFIQYPPVLEYGLTPLHFATKPASTWMKIFLPVQIEAHLHDLIKRQQADGGWKIFWEAPNIASQYEWRARWTLEAIQVLTAYGVVERD
jgi:hypothetical protein